METYSMDEIMVKIHGYSDTLKKFEFKEQGCGVKPWSHRSVHEDGRKIDTRGTDWSIYDKDDFLIATGSDSESLNKYLSERRFQNEVSKM